MGDQGNEYFLKHAAAATTAAAVCVNHPNPR